MVTEIRLGILSKSHIYLIKQPIESETFLLSRNKSCFVMFIKSIVYFEKKFVFLCTSYSDNASFKITIFSFS